MKLLQLGSMRWRVLAVYDHREDCHVLDVLVALGANCPAAGKMLRRLRSVIPEHGPNFENDQKAKHLDDGICEFKEQPQRGPKPRVFFFADGQTFICTEALAKRGDELSNFIARAKAIRETYFADKAARKLEIEVN